MKKKFYISGVVLMTFIGSTYGFSLDPGSEQDPIVTKSYVDREIAILEAEIETIEQEIKRLENLVGGGSSQNASGQSAGSFSYEVVTVPLGKTIIGGESAEIILRSGTATTIASSSGGIQDVTDGQDLSAGELTPKNHLLIVPKADGRGLLANTELVLMVRGDYTIQ
ncbi:MAG: hypothetical protein ATN35_06535 [Epulopiscium sp. Nele67-Bin004]|nr:MAG: hypothetical protein ATN35_06535 [Epulopiscium sp. Nele67-Bin004]